MKIKILGFCLALLCCMAVWADTVAYTYDDAGRLTRADYGNGQSISYTYDNAGNLLGRVVASANTASAPVAAKPEAVVNQPVSPTAPRSKPQKARRKLSGTSPAS